jgi:hypothetical protein
VRDEPHAAVFATPADFPPTPFRTHTQVSEGINFKYENARAVFLLGIPFPPFLDPKVPHPTPPVTHRRTVMRKLRIVPERFCHGATENGDSNEAQRPNFNGVRVARHLLLQRCLRDCAGVAKRQRERISHPNPSPSDSHLSHRCTAV